MDNNNNKIVDLQIPKSNNGANKKEKRNQWWRSLNILQNADSPEVHKVKHDEFKKGVTDDFDLAGMTASSRRKFLALMSASGAIAMASCTDYRDKGEIVPYNKKPNSVIPGIANYYASTLTGVGKGWGVLIKTREGRPIKIDGNPEHPINQGKISGAGQASIMNLYDRGRVKNPKMKTDTSMYLDDLKTSWADVDAKLIADFKNAVKAGKEIAIFTRAIYSPSTAQVFQKFQEAYPTAKFYAYEQINDANRQNAWKKSYGEGSSFPLVNMCQAKIILSVDSDFLGVDGDVVENTRQFTKNRDVDNLDTFSRLYSVEAAMSVTGSNADYRVRLTPELQYDFVMSVCAEVLKKGAAQISVDPSLATKLRNYSLEKFAQTVGYNETEVLTLNYLVTDIIANRGKFIARAGAHLPEETHIAVNLLNELTSGTELYNKKQKEVNVMPLASLNDMAQLAGRMKAGKVAVAIDIDSNPVYHLTDDIAFGEALSQVPTIVSFVEQENETTDFSSILLPLNHCFESWGDNEVRTGIESLQQPVISPMYDSREAEAAILTWASGKPETYSFDLYHKFVMNRWEREVYPKINSSASFKEFWFTCLHDGFITYNENVNLWFEFNQNAAINSKNSANKNGITVILTESYAVGDGRFAGNGFLQESPHPVSKVTWDNYASIAPATAKALNLVYDDLINVTVDGRSVTLPVMLQPGQALDTIVVDLGYGRTKAGLIGTEIGFDASVLMTAKGGVSQYIYTGATVSKTGDTYKLISTQEHHVLDDFLTKDNKAHDFQKVRNIIQEASVKDYKADPKVLKHHEHNIISITSAHEYKDVKWAMAIDMNKCIGCNECNIACAVENNIPVVGKDQVAMGREMGWIRIDTYYSGDYDTPEVSHQPMLCQHCDNAPCENVCPVVATTHSPDGLNQMAYNRCVGTRYCANNCPYKVRRYNFFDFRDHLASGYYKGDSIDLMMNPEVSIRARGVMEKCTFCIQRINESRQHSKEKGEVFTGANVVTACQEACPADAIAFGNSLDPNSKVSKLREHNLGYHVLEVLNVRPNVTYIAKLRNVETQGDHSERH